MSTEEEKKLAIEFMGFDEELFDNEEHCQYNAFISGMRKAEELLESKILDVLKSWSMYKLDIELLRMDDIDKQILSYDVWFHTIYKKNC